MTAECGDSEPQCDLMTNMASASEEIWAGTAPGSRLEQAAAASPYSSPPASTVAGKRVAGAAKKQAVDPGGFTQLSPGHRLEKPGDCVNVLDGVAPIERDAVGVSEGVIEDELELLAVCVRDADAVTVTEGEREGVFVSEAVIEGRNGPLV